MSNNTVPFMHDRKCDGCGALGAFDFMGDYICGGCFEGLPSHDGCGNECGADCPGDEGK